MNNSLIIDRIVPQTQNQRFRSMTHSMDDFEKNMEKIMPPDIVVKMPKIAKRKSSKRRIETLEARNTKSLSQQSLMRRKIVSQAKLMRNKHIVEAEDPYQSKNEFSADDTVRIMGKKSKTIQVSISNSN